MSCCLDASCLVRRITGDGPAGFDWEATGEAFASEVARLEVARTLNRLRIEGVYSDRQWREATAAFAELARGITWLPITAAVLLRAAQATPFHLRAADAIHLATALELRDAGVTSRQVVY